MSPKDIAALHCSELSAGLLPRLGVRFLERFYLLAVRCPGAIMLSTERGFLLGTPDAERFYRWMLPRLLPSVAVALIGNPSIIWRTLAVGGETSRAQPTKAQLLSIAVYPSARGTGVAADLLAEFRNRLVESGTRDFSVVASETQQAALRFYRKHGGVPVEEHSHGGLPSTTLVFSGGEP